MSFSLPKRQRYNNESIVGAGFGDSLLFHYDFEGEMDEERLAEILSKKRLFFKNTIRYREELKTFHHPGWEVLDGRKKPMYVAFVGPV